MPNAFARSAKKYTANHNCYNDPTDRNYFFQLRIQTGITVPVFFPQIFQQILILKMERFVLNLVILWIIIRIIVWIVVIFLIRLIIILVPSAAIIVSRMVRLNFLIAALVIITSRLIRTAALVLRRIFFRMKSAAAPSSIFSS